MTDSIFNLLPEEVILNCLKHLDKKSLLQMSFVCKMFSRLAEDKTLWITRCYKHRLASALIYAAGLETELNKGTISPHLFLKYVSMNNKSGLESVILPPKGTRDFSLCFASYQKPAFFPPRHPYVLYLNEQYAREKRGNVEKVVEWLSVNKTVDKNMLDKLMTSQMVRCETLDNEKGLSSLISHTH